MKHLIILILAITLVTAPSFGAECGYSPSAEPTKNILKTLHVPANRAGEMVLSFRADVERASWLTRGSEAAVVTVFADGNYLHDVVLFNDQEGFEYRVPLGPFEAFAGKKLVLVLNKTHSAPNIGRVRIRSAKISPSAAQPSSAAANSPVFYARPDTIGKFSDIPLLTYYEVFDGPDGGKRIRYTTIFTNEDGGTNSQALMARWGRVTDIEWTYEIALDGSGNVISETYQAANHETKPFAGKRIGTHPLLLNATINNNFSDTGCSALRMAPMLMRADLANRSRETVMDEFPWTYRIMSQEIIREGRVDPKTLGPNTIDDPRNYVYVELRTELENASVAVELEGPDGTLISSDWNDPRLRVDRSGFVRIAVRRPPNSRNGSFGKLRVTCSSVSVNKVGRCRTVNILKLVCLADDFTPVSRPIVSEPKTIGSGERASFYVE